MNKKILIIGAGSAGIAAATKLKSNGFQNITVLEAENRIGGRINTVRFGENVLDLGAQWCHGENGNVVYNMAKDKNLLSSNIPTYTNFNFIRSNGEQIPKTTADKMSALVFEIIAGFEEEKRQHNGSLGNYFADKYKQALLQKEFHDIDHELSEQIFDNFHKMENSLEASDDWYQTSCRSLLEYWQCEGDQLWNWKQNGFHTVLDLLQNKISNPVGAHVIDILPHIALNKEVLKIVYNKPIGGPIYIKCTDGSAYFADHLICTVSLGVLKEKHLSLFEPFLPFEKLKTIDGLMIGTVNKIFIEFEAPFWPEEWEGFSLLWRLEELKLIRNDPVNGSWLEGLMGFFRVSFQPNILCGWISGPLARLMEQKSDEEVKIGVMKVIRMFLKSWNVPDPKACIRSKWYSNPHFRGSYTHYTLKSDALGATTTKLAEPIKAHDGKPIIQFAGEATDRHYFSTVHGAIESGWREAQRLIDLYRIKSQL